MLDRIDLTDVRISTVNVMTIVASYKRAAEKIVCAFLLCMLGSLAPNCVVAQSTSSPTASEQNSAMKPKKSTARSTAQVQLDGCLTTSDGLMPKLTLFRSSKIYRLEARSMLLTENPLLFANNKNALVHVTGHLWDRDPTFMIRITLRYLLSITWRC
jgi:hypothetical protein